MRFVVWAGRAQGRGDVYGKIGPELMARRVMGRLWDLALGPLRSIGRTEADVTDVRFGSFGGKGWYFRDSPFLERFRIQLPSLASRLVAMADTNGMVLLRRSMEGERMARSTC